MPEAKANISIWENPEQMWLNDVIDHVKSDETGVIALYFPGCSVTNKGTPIVKYFLDLYHESSLLPSKRTTLLSFKDHFLALELCISRLKVKEDEKTTEVDEMEVMKLHEKYIKRLTCLNDEYEDKFLSSYEDFLIQSDCMTLWKLLNILETNNEIRKHISEHRYLLLGVPKSDILMQFLKFLLDGQMMQKIIIESPLNSSLENLPSSKASLTINIFEESISIENLTVSFSDNHGSATEEYSTELILAFLNLLVNCRNELALSKAMVSSIINLKHSAFTDLKHLANEKEMSMCQTVVSYVTKVKLGGKGYAPRADCPLRNYLKEFEQFVDLLNQLQTVIEEDLSRNAIKRVINITKNKLLRSDHKLRVESIENAARDLIETTMCLDQHESHNQETNQIGQKSLDILYNLVNHKAYSSSVLDPNAILKQSTLERTPLNLPPLMGYFRTPEEESEKEDSQMSISSLKSVKIEDKKEPAPVISYFHHSESNSMSKSCVDENTPSKTTFQGCLSSVSNVAAVKPTMQKERQPLGLISNQIKPNIKRALLNETIKPAAKKIKKLSTKLPKGKIQIKGQGHITSFFIKRD